MEYWIDINSFSVEAESEEEADTKARERIQEDGIELAMDFEVVPNG